MGYRHYFYRFPKAEIEAIKACKTNEELCNWAESRGYSVHRYDGEPPYISIYDLGKEIYEFGKYVGWAFRMQENNESIFGSDELKERYQDYGPVLCAQEDFLTAINNYKNNIIEYYKELLQRDEQAWKHHITGQLSEWENDFGLCAVNTDLSVKHITSSWLYEYAIFDLVRLYKTFDFENDVLVLLGW